MMCGCPTAHAAFVILRTFVTRWYVHVYMYVLPENTRFQVELDYGWGGVRSGASCPPSESSGANRSRSLQYYIVYVLSHDRPLWS